MDGRTMTVGSSGGTVCGTPAEVRAIARTIEDRGNEYNVAKAIKSQLEAGQTCAGRPGFVTVVVMFAPLNIEDPVNGPADLLSELASNNAAMLVFANLNTDSNTAEDWVVAINWHGTGYEANIDENSFRYVYDATSGAEGDLLVYESIAYQSGGAVFDANWLNDVEYGKILDKAFIEIVRKTVDELRRSSCSRCECREEGASCSSPVHVSSADTCSGLYGERQLELPVP